MQIIVMLIFVFAAILSCGQVSMDRQFGWGRN